jgi:hypothetical protein
LTGFDLLELAVTPVEPHACPVWMFQQGQSGAIPIEARVLLDEIIFRHVQVLGEGGDLLRGKSDIAGPSTAGSASLALKNGFHDRERAIPRWGRLAASTARRAFHGWK